MITTGTHVYAVMPAHAGILQRTRGMSPYATLAMFSIHSLAHQLASPGEHAKQFKSITNALKAV